MRFAQVKTIGYLHQFVEDAVGAREVAVQPPTLANGQAEIGLHGRRRLVDVMAVERQAGFEPEAVPRSEAGRVPRELIERNEAALTQFDVTQTLTRIAVNGGVSGGTAWHDAIFKNTARSTSFPGESGPFCDSAGFPGRINNFIVGCPGNAAPLVGQIDAWEGLSVANRFDLAPTGGENCGEARASFYIPPGTVTCVLGLSSARTMAAAMSSGSTGRFARVCAVPEINSVRVNGGITTLTWMPRPANSSAIALDRLITADFVPE